MDSILAIDDSRVCKAMLREIFDGIYRLKFRQDGRSGIDAALADPPDLILLDVQMPVMDGFETCRQLKVEPLLKDIPVIFLTSMDNGAEKVRAFEVGADDYVVKPFHREELMARVRAHLSTRRAARQAQELERLKVFRELAVAVNHEFNNPLTSMFAYLYLLQREVERPNPAVLKALDGLRREIERMQKITGRMARASVATTTHYSRDVAMIDLHGI